MHARRAKAAIAAVAIAMVTSITGVATASSASATEASCVKASKDVLSHVKNGTTVTVTLKGDRDLCDPFNMAYALYTYDNPSKGMWPQTLKSVNRATLKSPGSVTISAPEGCGQQDLYGMVGKEPQPSASLTGPGKPYEPPFVHETSKGPVTYSQDDPSSCVPKPVIEPTALLASICEEGASTLVADLSNVKSTESVPFTVNLSDGTTETKTVEAGKTATLFINYTGTIKATVTVPDGDGTKVIAEGSFSDDACQLPPPIEVVPGAVVGNAVCSASGTYASVTLDGTMLTTGMPSGNAGSAVAVPTDIKYVVATSAGYSKTVTVPVGEKSTVNVPLVEDKAVTVTVKVAGSSKVLTKKTITANCFNDSKPPTTSPKPPELADTGATTDIFRWGGLSLLAGVALILAARRPETVLVNE